MHPHSASHVSAFLPTSAEYSAPALLCLSLPKNTIAPIIPLYFLNAYVFLNSTTNKNGVLHIYFIHALFVTLSVLACWCAHAKYAQKLLTDLMTNYSSALRPVGDTNTILNVTLQVTLSQVIDMVKHHSAHKSAQDFNFFFF